MPATETPSRVVGKISDEARALVEERRRIRAKFQTAETEEEYAAIVREVVEISERINAEIARGFAE